MARVPLSKSQLRKEKESLVSYRRYLPALDLKRQQLMGERVHAVRAIRDAEAKVVGAAAEAGAALPMLADSRIDVSGLVTLGKIEYGTQNVAGVSLPILRSVEIIRVPYGRMVRPHWVDAVVERLEEAIRLRIEVDVARQRLAKLEKAVATTTQRVNLFDKVLIPEAEANIRRIMVYLGDAERAAVVGGKIAKRQRAAGGAT
ncbi:V-type ATP synthase subunit D [Kaistia algarum]|uniref:V-type ATP synthase subunit D n=1 Tax=Kaistia algarum TaxID=2083279 RepID=UPI000CE7FBAC|nr:V-type ATP synthase subunit D [Kaistia algarum]MCX5512966.1 V-type ATP synthase subunit D [Kaistia algarum]PPE81547.1 V-type ATP synthase subunit D [Kaistia algarum]